MKINYSKLKLKTFGLIIAAFSGFTLGAQNSYTFTPCAATGSVGPTQTQVNTSYTLTNLQNSVVSTGGIQSFTVPATMSVIRIETYGAQGGSGGSNVGGLGAKMVGDFTVTPGQVLKILPGQMGQAGSNQGGGGGGSYVVVGTNTPLCIAGGGGGAYYTSYSAGSTTNMQGTVSTTGNSGMNGSTSAVNAVGGSGGGGGTVGSTNTNPQGAGGGGLTGNGVAGYGATGGTAFVNGGTGGAAAGSPAGYGGFGGGGGSDWSSYTGGGGGGGYSGGGAGFFYGCGGGGGSYNMGANATNTSGVNSGAGKVIITELCSITLSATGTNSNSAICSGNSVSLTTNAVSNYSWSGGLTTSSIVVSPTVTTTYTLSALSASNCTSSRAITIFVNQAVPSLTVVNTATNGGICPTKTVMLTASGATSYSWTSSTITITNGVTFAPTVPDTYTVTGYNACGTGTAAASVSVHPAPSVTPVASSSSLCSGSSLTLTGVGNATAYVWSGSVLNGAGFSPAVSAIYTVTGTSALSCTASATIPITVVTTPSIASTASPSLICLGKSSTITATGATTYSWTDGTTVGTNSTYITTPTLTGIMSYSIFRANSTCTTSQIVNVIVNALPSVFAISNPTGVCAGKPTTLTAAGAQTYTWTSPGAPPTQASFTFTGASPLAFPLVPSIYSVAAHDGTCVNTTTVFVHADPNPTITATASSPTLCSGSTATINATGGINYSITSSASTATFSSFPIIETLTTTAAYNITGDNSFGCTSSIIQIVQIYGNPTLTATQNRTIVCSGGNVTVTASGANTYAWSSGATTSNTILNPVSLVTAPVIFTVTGTFTNTMCHSDKTIAVTVFIPTLTVSGATSICTGGTLNLTAGGGTGNSNYRWYTIPGSAATSSSSILNSTLSAPAVFTLTGLTTSGTASLCPSTKTLDVNIYFNPTITAVAQRSVICVNEFVVITGNGGDSYEWSTGFATNTISVNPKSNTNYTVVGKDLNGCVNTATLQIKVSSCVGVENLVGNSGLSIFPNPNNGEFSIKAAGNLKLQLMNELGQIVRNIELSGANNYKVSVNDLAKGIYFLSCEKDGQQIRQKIIVAK